MNIIGLMGKAGSGKDQTADYLVEDCAYVKVSLADPMKRSVMAWFRWDDQRLWGPSDFRNQPDPKFNGLTARKVLQFLGTEVGRELYRDVWIEYALHVASCLLTGGYAYDHHRGLIAIGHTDKREPFGVVIPDVRFSNEVVAIRAAGGKVVRIVRPGAGLQGAASQHASETEQDACDVDLTMYNDKDLDTLRAMAVELPLLFKPNG